MFVKELSPVATTRNVRWSHFPNSDKNFPGMTISTSVQQLNSKENDHNGIADVDVYESVNPFLSTRTPTKPETCAQ